MNLEDIKFDYLEDFVDEVIENIHEDEDCFISIFAKYEQASEIIKELLAYDFVELDNIDLHSEGFDGYADEYIVELWSDCGTVYIGCEPAKRNGEYFKYDGNICFLFEDCNSKIIKNCDYDEMYDVVIEECNEEDFDGCDECCECCDCCNEDGKIHGFAAKQNTENGYRTFSFYNTKGLDDAGVLAMLKMLGF